MRARMAEMRGTSTGGNIIFEGYGYGSSNSQAHPLDTHTCVHPCTLILPTGLVLIRARLCSHNTSYVSQKYKYHKAEAGVALAEAGEEEVEVG